MSPSKRTRAGSPLKSEVAKYSPRQAAPGAGVGDGTAVLVGGGGVGGSVGAGVSVAVGLGGLVGSGVSVGTTVGEPARVAVSIGPGAVEVMATDAICGGGDAALAGAGCCVSDVAPVRLGSDKGVQPTSSRATTIETTTYLYMVCASPFSAAVRLRLKVLLGQG